MAEVIVDFHDLGNIPDRDPDEIIKEERDDLTYKEEIWLTEKGLITRVTFNKKKSKLNLNEQLQEALKIQDFETAAKIRDKLKKL